MPTAEGTFPKVGNDPLYYSEVNKFNTDHANQTYGLANGITPTGDGSNMANITDTSITTYGSLSAYSSNAAPATASIVIDLGATKDIKSIVSKIYYEHTAGGATSATSSVHYIECSVDNVTYDVFYSRSNSGATTQTGTDVLETMILNNSYRYVRIRVVATGSNTGPTFASRALNIYTLNVISRT